MGMYDSFYAPCPGCGKLLEVQTKDFQCSLEVWKPGDELPETFDANRSDGPHSYCSCKSDKSLIVMIRNGVFVGYTRNPEEAEGMLPVEKDALNAIVSIYEQKVQEGQEKTLAFQAAMSEYNEELAKRIKSNSPVPKAKT